MLLLDKLRTWIVLFPLLLTLGLIMMDEKFSIKNILKIMPLTLIELCVIELALQLIVFIFRIEIQAIEFFVDRGYRYLEMLK